MTSLCTLTSAIRLGKFGGPEVMRFEAIELLPPAAGEVRVRQTAIGFNYIDLYQRSGKYPLSAPTGLGHEAAGVIDAVGAGVDDWRIGDRAVYMNAGVGAYAEWHNVPAAKLVAIPDGIADEDAAAVFFKAMTAQYLVKKTYAVRAGDIVLVHAAAGGVGQILSGWAAALGATVIGTAGPAAKCATALEAGCSAAINYNQPGWVERVVEASAGRKARVVYDSVAQHTFLGSLDCAAPSAWSCCMAPRPGLRQPSIQSSSIRRAACS